MSNFVCPKCGSSFFSSAGPKGLGLLAPTSEWTGRCKGHFRKVLRGRVIGYEYTGCDFTWSRADDAKYGLVKHGAPT